MAESVATSLIESVVAEYLKRILDKASRGKRLSDWEVGVLMMNYIERRLEERIDSVERRLEERIDSVERRLEERINAVEKRLEERINSVEKSLNERINAVEKSLTERINSLEKRLEKVEDDIDYIKKSLDSLRDNVINILVEELKRRMS